MATDLALHTYDQAIAYLTGRLDFERKPDPQPFVATHYSLDRFRGLVEAMGRPDRAFRSIHVAGTKGKGSVCAMLEGALLAAGRSTGFYLSPHLRDFTERIRVGGAPISRDEFTRMLRERVAPFVEAEREEFDREIVQGGEGLPFRTVFELLTALGFAVFERARVEWAVVETGLGGRLDCTNVVEPEIAVITSLGLDHTHLLGDTLGAIAREKGGIIKPRVPVVVAAQTPAARAEAVPVLERIAAERESPLYMAERLADAETLDRRSDGQVVRLRAAGEKSGGGDALDRAIRLPLVGDHQRENARTAAAVWAVLRREHPVLTWDAFAQGLEKVRWPGRVEIFETRPRVVLDGAHCPLSARALRRTIDELFGAAPRHVVFGVQADKQVARVLETMAAAGPADARSWAFYHVPGGRGATVEALARTARELGIPRERITLHDSAETAFREAVSRAGVEDVVVACGTLYSIAALEAIAGELPPGG